MFWETFEKTAKQKLMSSITSSIKPSLVVVIDPNETVSQKMVKNLDRAMSQNKTFKKPRLVVLNKMYDQGLIRQLKVRTPSVVLYRSGRRIDSIEHGSTMQFTEFLNKHRKDLT